MSKSQESEIDMLARVSRKIAEEAEDYVSKWGKLYRAKKITKDLNDFIKEDGKRLKEVAMLFFANRLHEAYKEALNLDTVVRELIPKEAWLLMSKRMMIIESIRNQ